MPNKPRPEPKKRKLGRGAPQKILWQDRVNTATATVARIHERIAALEKQLKAAKTGAGKRKITEALRAKRFEILAPLERLSQELETAVRAAEENSQAVPEELLESKRNAERAMAALREKIVGAE